MTLDRGSLIASVSVHVVGLAVMLIAPALRDDDILYEVVSVQIYSPPPTPAPPEEEPAPPEPEDELVVETPDPEPPAEEPEPEPEPAPPEPEPEPDPDPDPDEPEEPEIPDPPTEDPPPDPSPTPPEEVPTEEPASPPPAEDTEDPEEDGLDLNVRQEAFSRDYPEYYANIVMQMRRCFRPPDQDREATVSFSIRRDGTTTEIDMHRSSGSFVFDLAAQEAVECVGKSGRLGSLPDEYPLEWLPILFRFSPPRR